MFWMLIHVRETLNVGGRATARSLTYDQQDPSCPRMVCGHHQMDRRAKEAVVDNENNNTNGSDILLNGERGGVLTNLKDWISV